MREIMFKRILCISFLLLPAFLAACGPSSTTYQSQAAAAVEWKSELIVNVTILRAAEVGQSKMVFEFHGDANMGGQPALLFPIPVLAANENGKISVAYDFTDLTNGTYYVRAYLDENSNRTFDAGEASGVYRVKGEPSPITLETGKRQAISLSVE